MPQVIGIKFRNSAKIYYFSPESIEGLGRGDYVIVETVRGQEAGMVAFPTREIEEEAWSETQRILEMGGATAGVESGYMKRALVESNTARVRAIETGDRVVVSVTAKA